jgi:hypothetical protein
MDIHYEGIRLTPAEIVSAAAESRPHVVGLSILSGSHLPLIAETMERMRAAGLAHPGGRRRHHPRGRRRPPARDGRGRSLHAQGFRTEPDHAGHRGAWISRHRRRGT